MRFLPEKNAPDKNLSIFIIVRDVVFSSEIFSTYNYL